MVISRFLQFFFIFFFLYVEEETKNFFTEAFISISKIIMVQLIFNKTCTQRV